MNAQAMELEMLFMEHVTPCAYDGALVLLIIDEFFVFIRSTVKPKVVAS